MPDKYDALRERYDGLVKDVVPKLTAETVDEAVRAVNILVRLQRPRDWAFSEEPRAVLGMTSDGERAVYGEVTRFGFYHAVPVDELHQSVSGMVDKARTDYEKQKDNPDAFFRRVSYERLQHVEGLLKDVVALRSE